MSDMTDLIMEAERINSCWQAVASMLSHDGEVDRDKAAVLMDYLSERQSELLEQMHRQRRHAA